MKVRDFLDLACVGDWVLILGLATSEFSFEKLFFGRIGGEAEPNEKIMNYDIGQIAPYFEAATGKHPARFGYIIYV